MQELEIKENDSGQRIDRFLKKYLNKAPNSFIYRMLRKKNIELNRKKVSPETIIHEGDKIQLFLADETIDRFREEDPVIKTDIHLDIIYEDDNILIINKPSGILSHGSGGPYEPNIVDGMINYLIGTKAYNPRSEHNFTPSICNRLDRNTSGLIIGAKNYGALKEVNELMRDGRIQRFYKTIVYGKVGKTELVDYLIKDEENNKVEVVAEPLAGAKKIVTKIQPIKFKNGYSLIEVELVTGRTHQIRAHLKSTNNPIIGDRKYGREDINRDFRRKYKLTDQYLHGYKLVFPTMEGEFSNLNRREFVGEATGLIDRIEKDMFR